MKFANAIGRIGGQKGTKFYLKYKDDEEVQQLVAQVPWGHNIILMEIRKKTIFIIRIFSVNFKEQIKNEYYRNL